ncbi:MAG TPA: hypothetical protein VHD81_00860 [Mycobacteriales bacterium]|nr:hypothetical protein [Mycobacteriales bacterium]
MSELPTDPVESLAMHLALTMNMIQSGTPLSLLQQQLVTVRAKAKLVIDDEDTPGSTRIQITHPIPESVAEALSDDVVIPDDIASLGNEGQIE